MDNYERREKLKLEISEETEEKPHFHQDIELIYVLQGMLEAKIGEQTTEMKKEDILIINANQRHELHGSEDVMYARLTILYELMGDVLLDRDVVLVCDTTKNDTSACEGLRRLIQKLISHYLTTHENTADFRLFWHPCGSEMPLFLVIKPLSEVWTFGWEVECGYLSIPGTPYPSCSGCSGNHMLCE